MTEKEMPPFGSTDIIECNDLRRKPFEGRRGRHSVALISSSATANRVMSLRKGVHGLLCEYLLPLKGKGR